MPEASYALADTAHGPWWFAWTDAGVCATAQGELTEAEFLERVAALGLSGPLPADAARRPDTPDLSRVSGAFRRQALEACSGIPAGQVRTYGEIASECGSPGAARAVGSAMAQNPVPGLVPCHRVVREDGRLGDYSAGGSARKKAMLVREGVAVNDGRVATGSAE